MGDRESGPGIGMSTPGFWDGGPGIEMGYREKGPGPRTGTGNKEPGLGWSTGNKNRLWGTAIGPGGLGRGRGGGFWGGVPSRRAAPNGHRDRGSYRETATPERSGRRSGETSGFDPIGSRTKRGTERSHVRDFVTGSFPERRRRNGGAAGKRKTAPVGFF